MDLSKSTDSELQSISQQIADEQKRRQEIISLREDAKTASEKMILIAQSLESMGDGHRFDFIASLLPEEFVDWLSMRGGQRRTAWRQPQSADEMYKSGDVVVYKGETYKSITGQNSFSPEDAPSQWEKI